MGLPRKGRKSTDIRGLENADVVMGRLREGSSLKDSLYKVGTYDGFRSQCVVDPAWGQEARALAERNAAKGLAIKLRCLKVDERRAKTHCKHGHPFTPENTILNRRWPGRECRTCKLEHLKTTGPSLSAEDRAIAVAALRRRVRYVELKKLVNINAFYRTRARDPEFDAICRECTAGARERMLRRKVAKNGREQFEWIRSLIPARIPDDDKIEIVSMVVEAHRRRTFRRKPFGIRRTQSRMKEFVAEFYKQNPTKAYGRADSPWSLDAPMNADSRLTLAETATRSIWDEVPT